MGEVFKRGLGFGNSEIRMSEIVRGGIEGIGFALRVMSVLFLIAMVVILFYVFFH